MQCVEHVQNMKPLVFYMLTMFVVCTSYGWTVKGFAVAFPEDKAAIHGNMIGLVPCVQV